MSEGAAVHKGRLMANVINLAVARERREADRDAAVTVITQLPADVAVQLLSENGWRVSDGPLGGCWTAPDGSLIYGIDQALEVALVGSSRR
jgi:hypothetical protein